VDLYRRHGCAWAQLTVAFLEYFEDTASQSENRLACVNRKDFRLSWEAPMSSWGRQEHLPS
jgi:hypothetical protein